MKQKNTHTEKSPLLKKSFQGWPKRINLVILFFTSNLICYMDRINISVTAPLIMKELEWDEASLGIILSAFFLGYTLLQIPGGWLADRYGGKKVLAFGVLWWSLFTMITPLARTITGMAAMRTLMGVGEGVNFPSIQSVMAKWIPVAERSRVMGFTLSGISVGNIIAFPLATWIMLTLGWRSVFYIFGLFGFIWCVFWLLGAANRPEEHTGIGSEELQYIQENRPDITPVASVPWKTLLSKMEIWTLVVNHFCVSWGFFMFLTWLPTYLMRAHGFSIKEMGLYSMLPYLAMVIGSNGTGWLADNWIKRTGNITRVRKIVHSVSLFSAALFLMLLPQAETKMAVILCVTLALGMLSMTGSSTGPNAMDVAPRYAGIIMGMQTTAGNIAGIIVPLIVGLIVALSNRWDLVFYIAAGILLFGVIMWDIFATGSQVLD
jgi:ACS family sodium-dependent inorganic phosphate cotransporter